jgi:hypothetical protein
MLNSRSKHHHQTILTNALNAVLTEFPLAAIAFGVGLPLCFGFYPTG